MTDLLGSAGFSVVSLACAFVGWRCWTGPWRFRVSLPITFLAAWARAPGPTMPWLGGR